MMILRGQCSRSQARSFQVTVGSNCCAIHSDSVFRPPVPFMRASRLPKVRRLPVSTLSAQVGRMATSNTFFSVRRGGMDRPFLASRRRRPCTGMSTVSMMAEQLAALARSSSS